jgi:hypothetical protein
MKRMVYLIEQPLDERNFDRFGIQIWLDRAWSVEIWDFTRLAHPGLWKDFTESGRTLRHFAGYFPFAAKRELHEHMAGRADLSHFIDFTGEEPLPLLVKRALIRSGAKRIVCAPGSIPTPDPVGQHSRVRRLLNLVLSQPFEALNVFKKALDRKWSAASIRPGVVVASGEASIAAATTSAEVINVHAFDYDIFLRLKSLDKKFTPPFGVFIDQDLCFHPDFIRQGVPAVVTPARYFPALCSSLRSIGRKFGIEIRIAAHPRATYAQRGVSYFAEFPLHYSQTAELIRDSEVVVCHDSTAIHFAVLFEKPMIFVTTDELISTYEGRSVAKAAAEFGKTAINLDRDLTSVDWRAQSRVDTEIYRRYRSKYIKLEGSPERPMFEIICEHVERSRTSDLVRVSEDYASAGRSS